jgi:cell division protein FtsW
MTTAARPTDPLAVGGYDRRVNTRPTPYEPEPINRSQVRERWRMGVEARALVLLTAVLVAFGLVTLYSASAIAAMTDGRSSAFYLLKQLTGVAAGAVVFAIFAKVDAERWRAWAWPLMGLALALMALTVLPFTQGIAPRINGSRRFLLGGSLQPSELAKLAVIVWTSMLIVKKQELGLLHRVRTGLLPFLAVVGALAAMAALEPDLSVAMTFFLIMGIVLFAGGVRIGFFVFMGALATPVLWHEIERLQYVMLRMVSFLDPGKAPEKVSYQLQQSLVAVGAGGLFGVGFGEGRQQYGFLPYPYSDFIGSNVGEEWGFVGLALLTAAWSLYTWLGFRIARQARSRFQFLVAVGLTTMMSLTAYLHIGVVIGLMPTTGLTLPFFSYGRSNLVLSLLMTAILVNIGSERQRVVGETATNPLAP